ncbi:MRPS11 family protein [Megaselia abdita]
MISLNAVRKLTNVRCFSSTQLLRKAEDRKERLASLPQKDQGTAGESSSDIDALMKSAALSADQLRDSVFHALPIVNIRTSPNNTIINVTDSSGVPRLIRSCGIEGFKNARKGTNIAAQATAVNIAAEAIDLGWKTVRVNVSGLGPGRMSSIKGLQLAGLNIVSITDKTPISFNPPRPRKARKL